MRRIFVFTFIFLPILIMAQPLVRYNLYPFNPNFSNPAATGLTDCTILTATDMHQWIGIEDTPSIQSVSLQKGIYITRTKKHGLGTNLIHDANGPSSFIGGEFIYSFQFKVGRIHPSWLSLSLSGSAEQRRLSESGFSPIYDPLVSGGTETEFVYNASSGVFLYNDTYFAGFAVYNLLPANSLLGQGYGSDSFFMSVQGGYLIHNNRLPFKIQSSFQGFKGNNIIQVDWSNKLIFDNNFWGGIILRKYLGQFELAGQNAIVFIGYDWKRWSFTYNYNIDINGTQFHHYGTHQLSVSYKICPDKYSCPAYK